MSQSTFTAVVVGAISGAVTAVVVSLALSPSATSRGALAGEPSTKPGALTDVASVEELSQLRLENQALELRIASLEARPAAAVYRAPVEQQRSPEEPLAANGLVDGVRAAGPLEQTTGISQAYYDNFRVAADMYDAEKRAAREEERRLDRERRNEERVQQLAERLNLDEYQTSRVRGILGNQDAQRAAAFEAMRGDGALDRSREEIRESMRKIEEDANMALQAVLTPIQFEEYEASSRRTFGGRGGGGAAGGRERRGGNRGNG